MFVVTIRAENLNVEIRNFSNKVRLCASCDSRKIPVRHVKVDLPNGNTICDPRGRNRNIVRKYSICLENDSVCAICRHVDISNAIIFFNTQNGFEEF
jgi:hypothetical protein